MVCAPGHQKITKQNLVVITPALHMEGLKV